MSLSRTPREWGFWTEVKLDTLERYLSSFTIATKRAPARVYLDLFAGQVENVRRDDPEKRFDGSTVRALRIEPPFEHLVFFELHPEAQRLETDLSRRYPHDHRYSIIRGDCNETIQRALDGLRCQGLDRSPTFAFVDPYNLGVKWSTLSAIARFKHPKIRTKAEMWILLSYTAIARLAGLDGSLGLDQHYSAAATSLFGTHEWYSIYDRRTEGKLTAGVARDLYVRLFRFQLENELAYQRTLTIEMGNRGGAPVYTMVFATDSPPGVRIMSSVYEKARAQAAEYRAEVAERVARQQRLDSGRPNLFDAAEGSLQESPIYYESIEDDKSPNLPKWLRRRL